MTRERIGNAILSLLVLISLTLSYAIWHGNWLNHSEVGFTDTVTAGDTTTSPFPQLAQAEAPYQIVLHGAGNPAGYSVSLPGTPDYQDWVQSLGALTVTGLKPMLQASITNAPVSVRFVCGTTVERSALMTLIPALQNTALAERVQTIQLYQMAPGQSVMMELSSPSEPDIYLGRTNFDPNDFTRRVVDAVKQNPWIRVGTAANSLLPMKGMNVTEYQWKQSQIALLPTVHSFFVNPAALTRIQESNGEVLWTDGSRAVQWNKSQSVLLFDDPNAGTSGLSATNSLPTALTFMHSHGGGPANLLAFGGTYSSRGMATFAFTPFVNGLPVLDRSTDYHVSMNDGHVVEYQRPTINAGIGSVAGQVRTLSAQALITAIQRQWQHKNLSAWTCTFGYAVTTDTTGHQVLQPVVQLAGPEQQLIQVDAVTGQILQGGQGI